MIWRLNVWRSSIWSHRCFYYVDVTYRVVKFTETDDTYVCNTTNGSQVITYRFCSSWRRSINTNIIYTTYLIHSVCDDNISVLYACNYYAWWKYFGFHVVRVFIRAEIIKLSLSKYCVSDVDLNYRRDLEWRKVLAYYEMFNIDVNKLEVGGGVERDL